MSQQQAKDELARLAAEQMRRQYKELNKQEPVAAYESQLKASKEEAKNINWDNVPPP